MRNVRNFWIQADIDGRTGRLAGGPASKDGGLDIALKQRDNGAVTTALEITARAANGALVLTVRDGDGVEVFQHVTQR